VNRPSDGLWFIRGRDMAHMIAGMAVDVDERFAAERRRQRHPFLMGRSPERQVETIRLAATGSL
jgi:hypothetical protein